MTDAQGDSQSPKPGTDLAKLYLARDGQYLYAIIETYNGLPGPDDFVFYQINLAKNPDLGPAPGDNYLISIDYNHPWETWVFKVISIEPGSPSQLLYKEIVALAGDSLETRVQLDQINNPSVLDISAASLEYVEGIGQTAPDWFPSHRVVSL
jgi:hypothetical protein